MTIVDATVRLIPEVLGKEASHKDDSFSSGFEFPLYTRPAGVSGRKFRCSSSAPRQYSTLAYGTEFA